jgi:2-dehydro-3-deoxyphosphogluconate aldolase/(4S)-4-hydroxy-2-oxoglutarate aldolase
MVSSHSFPRFTSRVIPVVVLDSPDQALPLGQALLEGGIDVIEVTLRTSAGGPAISLLRQVLPEIVVTAGSILTDQDLDAARNAGAVAAFSPGGTADLLAAGAVSKIPLIPGVATPSELMQAMTYGYKLVKFFPAETFGGLGALNAFAGPFAGMRFCPTGGVNRLNLADYLRHPSVAFVGGTWIAPLSLVRDQRWEEIARLAREATEIVRSLEETR